MKVLITGGCGFIGSHVCSHFLKTTSWDLTVLDGLTYAGDVSRLVAIDGYDAARVKIVYHDLRSPISERLRSQIGPVDVILNLASESFVDRSIADPVSFIQNNVSIMLHVLEYAREVEPQALVHISTDEVFGPANSGVKYQEWDRQLPSNPYSCSKSCQEMICVAHWRTYGVPVIIVPLMNSFGEGQNKEKFIPTIVRSLLSRKNIPVHAEKIVDGSWRAGSRTWLHAANQADALKTIILRSERLIDIHRFPEGDRPFKVNVGGDKEMDNLAVVRLIGEILGIEPKIDFQDIHSQRPGHDRRYALDSSVIKNLFGWTPPIPLEESFRRTVKWMADNKEKWL